MCGGVVEAPYYIIKFNGAIQKKRKARGKAKKRNSEKKPVNCSVVTVALLYCSAIIPRSTPSRTYEYKIYQLIRLRHISTFWTKSKRRTMIAVAEVMGMS